MEIPLVEENTNWGQMEDVGEGEWGGVGSYEPDEGGWGDIGTNEPILIGETYILLTETRENPFLCTVEFINEKDILITESKFSLDKRIEAFNVTPLVDIKNNLSERYSVIEVSGKDRPGLLYELATIISDLKLNIYSAHISTFGEQASDVFYVLNYDGSKILQNRLNIKMIIGKVLLIQMNQYTMYVLTQNICH